MLFEKEPFISDQRSEHSGFVFVKDGKANAAIVIAQKPTIAANLAALEIQYHIEKITGAVVPIKTDTQKVQGNRILVSESKATRKLGLRGSDFAPQEYLIRFLPETVILIGRDWQDTPENRKEVGLSTNDFYLQDSRHKINYTKATQQSPKSGAGSVTIKLPGVFDDQGTCYATYDFLEYFCDVRWYGPIELNIVFPQRETLTVGGKDVRRSPTMTYRTDGIHDSDFGLWNNPTRDQIRLYARRLCTGGEKWAGNHSMTGFYHRFM